MALVACVPDEQWVTVEGPDGTRWRADAGFLSSRWRCQWGRGCQGIHDHPTPELMQGCCSEGVELVDADDALNVAAHAACIPDGLWQRAAQTALPDGIFRDTDPLATTVVDGACVFFNRPGHAGGVGCALHLGALALGEPPIEWKPRVCWQLPLWAEDLDDDDDGHPVVLLRRWKGADWGESPPHWWCTAAPEAYDGEEPVVSSMADELTALCGADVAALLRAAVELDGDGDGDGDGAGAGAGAGA